MKKPPHPNLLHRLLSALHLFVTQAAKVESTGGREMEARNFLFPRISHFLRAHNMVMYTVFTIEHTKVAAAAIVTFK